jgi:hypothetical protein
MAPALDHLDLGVHAYLNNFISGVSAPTDGFPGATHMGPAFLKRAIGSNDTDGPACSTAEGAKVRGIRRRFASAVKKRENTVFSVRWILSLIA